MIATASRDGSVKVWDLERFKGIPCPSLPGASLAHRGTRSHSGASRAGEEDSSTIETRRAYGSKAGAYGSLLCSLGLAGKLSHSPVGQGPDGPGVTSLIWGTDGKSILTAGGGIVKLWNTQQGANGWGLIGSFPLGESSASGGNNSVAYTSQVGYQSLVGGWHRGPYGDTRWNPRLTLFLTPHLA